MTTVSAAVLPVQAMKDHLRLGTGFGDDGLQDALIEAHLRAKENLLVIANMRGESPEAIGSKLFTQTSVGGLQGPTISQIVTRESNQGWYSVTIVVRRDHLSQAVGELRKVGGSGIIVTPVTYIFEEEPPRYTAMLEALKG